MVEGARLESVYTATYRGFEPLSLRHLSIQRDAKNTKNPQVIWLSGFFIVQRNATRFIGNRVHVGGNIWGNLLIQDGVTLSKAG